MMFPDPDSPGNPFSSEIRVAARNLLVVAAKHYTGTLADAERTFGYFLRTSLAHGLTLSEIGEITGIDCTEILRLTDPMAA